MRGAQGSPPEVQDRGRYLNAPWRLLRRLAGSGGWCGCAGTARARDLKMGDATGLCTLPRPVVLRRNRLAFPIDQGSAEEQHSHARLDSTSRTSTSLLAVAGAHVRERSPTTLFLVIVPLTACTDDLSSIVAVNGCGWETPFVDDDWISRRG